MGREGGGGVRGALIERRLEMNPKLVIDRSADQRVKAGNRGRGSLNSTLLHRSSLLSSAQCRGATEFVFFYRVSHRRRRAVVDPWPLLLVGFFFSRNKTESGYRVLPGFSAGCAGRWRRQVAPDGAGGGRGRPVTCQRSGRSHVFIAECRLICIRIRRRPERAMPVDPPRPSAQPSRG